MPAFGQSGPWRDFVGFAPTIEQLSGLPELTGYRDGPPVLTGHSVADPCAGLFGAFAALAVLRHRAATAGGAHVDLSQLEAMTSLLGPELVAEQLGAPLPARAGNSDPGLTPSGCYPAAGNDNLDRDHRGHARRVGWAQCGRRKRLGRGSSIRVARGETPARWGAGPADRSMDLPRRRRESGRSTPGAPSCRGRSGHPEECV